MSQITVRLNLPSANLAFDESKNPVMTASNGIPYVDVPAVGFYAGTHKGVSYSRDHVRQLEDSFSRPTEDLYGSIPIMIDHSSSNKDKIGHLRSVQTVGDASHIVARLVGADAIQGLREGKYRTMSAGLTLTQADDDEMSAKHTEDVCPECGADMSDDDDGVCPECGHEMSKADDDDDGDEGQHSRARFSAGRNFTASYDHHCFTPFPALPDCKTYSKKRSANKMSEKTVKTYSESQMDELRATATKFEAEFTASKALLATEKAAREAAETDTKQAKEDARFAARRYEASILTEEYLKSGKITPASKEFHSLYVAALEPEMLDLHKKFMEHQPAVVLFGTLGNADTRKPEEQNPIKGAGQEVQSAAAELLKFARKHKGE